MPKELVQELSQWFGDLSTFDQIALSIIAAPVLHFVWVAYRSCYNCLPTIQKNTERMADELHDYIVFMKGEEQGKK